MKSTGITRPVDELGRIVIPKEIRRSFKIQNRDLLEIYIEGDSIVLRKTDAVCVICGSGEQTEEVNGKYVCRNCMAKINSMYKGE